MIINDYVHPKRLLFAIFKVHRCVIHSPLDEKLKFKTVYLT